MRGKCCWVKQCVVELRIVWRGNHNTALVRDLFVRLFVRADARSLSPSLLLRASGKKLCRGGQWRAPSLGNVARSRAGAAAAGALCAERPKFALNHRDAKAGVAKTLPRGRECGPGPALARGPAGRGRASGRSRPAQLLAPARCRSQAARTTRPFRRPKRTCNPSAGTPNLLLIPAPLGEGKFTFL